MTTPPPRTPFVKTPNAEKHMLEADTLRRRQLRSALLHGSSRTWRDRQRIWPTVVAGFVAVAVIVAAIAVYGAFRKQTRLTDEERRKRDRPAVTATPAATPTAKPATAR